MFRDIDGGGEEVGGVDGVVDIGGDGGGGGGGGYEEVEKAEESGESESCFGFGNWFVSGSGEVDVSFGGVGCVLESVSSKPGGRLRLC